jgi:riboflavin-specific deaminase-like protein
MNSSKRPSAADLAGPIRNIRELQEAFAGAADFRSRTGRPFVTLTYAQSVDGSIAGRHKERMLLSGTESLRLTHRLRSAHDAILVGIGTVLADDPLLTVRFADGDSPQPIVLDTNRRIPRNARLLQRTDTEACLVSGRPPEADPSGREEPAADHVRCRLDERGLIDLNALMEVLDTMQINTLMVEGGAKVISSFVAAGLVDLCVITIAPCLVGGLQVLGSFASPRIGLLDPSYERLGPDMVLWARPERNGS